MRLGEKLKEQKDPAGNGGKEDRREAAARPVIVTRGLELDLVGD